LIAEAANARHSTSSKMTLHNLAIVCTLCSNDLSSFKIFFDDCLLVVSIFNLPLHSFGWVSSLPV
jgi:hypothetical protein